MNVRAVITWHRSIKYEIDGILYEHEMYIPEIVRDKKIESYGKLKGIMIITTKRHVKE